MTVRFSMRWVLSASLAVNVFLAIVAVMGLQFPPPPPGPPNPMVFAERMAEILPAADAAILRQSFADHAGKLERTKEMSQDVRERVADVLRAPDFDPEALKTAFAAGRAAREVQDGAFAAAMAEAAARMSAEGRRKLADWKPPRPPR